MRGLKLVLFRLLFQTRHHFVWYLFVGLPAKTRIQWHIPRMCFGTCAGMCVGAERASSAFARTGRCAGICTDIQMGMGAAMRTGADLPVY